MQYGLYVKIAGHWQKLAEFDATDNADAFGKGISRLPREYYDKPMALRPVHDAPVDLIEPPTRSDHPDPGN